MVFLLRMIIVVVVVVVVDVVVVAAVDAISGGCGCGFPALPRPPTRSHNHRY